MSIDQPDLLDPQEVRIYLDELESTDKCWKIHNIRPYQPNIIIEVNVVMASFRQPKRPLIMYRDVKDSTNVHFSYCSKLFFTSKEAAERELVIRKLTGQRYEP